MGDLPSVSPEQFYSLSMDDQQAYFGRTYFRISHNHKKELPKVWVWCNSFAYKNIAKLNLDKGEMLTDLSLRKEATPDFSFPESGLYNYKNSFCFFQKIPARQQKKGLCPESGHFTPFKSLFKNEEGKGLLVRKRDDSIWRIEGIQEIFKEESNKKFSLDYSLEVLKNGRTNSIALDREFGLSLGVYSKYPSLWYKMLIIGKVISNKRMLLSPDCLFRQEVADRFLPEDVQITEGL